MNLSNRLDEFKNCLNLNPKARKWIFFEFFYSIIDAPIFLGENDFSLLLKEYFPKLQSRNLRRQEWSEVRRLIGKPRRCSQKFFEEEREALYLKREKIFSVYFGSFCHQSGETFDSTLAVQKPLVIGNKVFVSMKYPTHGIYAGTVDAIVDRAYRIVFDDSSISPRYVDCHCLMYDRQKDFIRLNNNVLQPNNTNDQEEQFSDQQLTAESVNTIDQNRSVPTKDGKIGNFPLRMVVIIAKLCKLLELKKTFVSDLICMNDCATKIEMFSNSYPDELKIKYAQTVIDLESVNRLIKTYSNALDSYKASLLPHLSKLHRTDKPDSLKKSCTDHAQVIVNRCTEDLELRSPHIINLINDLVSLLKLIRVIGVDSQPRQMCPFESSLLSQSLKTTKSSVSPKNVGAFQDIEIRLKEIIKLGKNPSEFF